MDDELAGSRALERRGLDVLGAQRVHVDLFTQQQHAGKASSFRTRGLDARGAVEHGTPAAGDLVVLQLLES